MLNLTPHDIVVDVNGAATVFPASGVVARLKVETTLDTEVNGIPVYLKNVVGTVDLPLDDQPIIVSGMVLDYLMANPLRKEGTTFAPNTNDAIRNDKGHIIAVKSLLMV